MKIDQRDGRDTYVYYANFDWYHYLFKDEHPNTSHSVSLSGGNSKVKYMLSGNYYSEEGLFRQDPDRLQRINFRSKISFDINKWLKSAITPATTTTSTTTPAPAESIPPSRWARYTDWLR